MIKIPAYTSPIAVYERKSLPKKGQNSKDLVEEYKKQQVYKAKRYKSPPETYGVACCRTCNINVPRPQILLIQRKTTYYYAQFLTLSSVPDETYLRRMFDNMTIEEKNIILSFDFTRIWLKMWNVCNNKMFYVFKVFFEENFAKRAPLLRKMILGSKNARLPWEIPKGRKSSASESSIVCGVREFCEETGMSKRDFYITDKSIDLSHESEGVTYNTKLYIGVAKGFGGDSIAGELSSETHFIDQRVYAEISDLRWMDMNMVKSLNQPALTQAVSTIFSVYKDVRKLKL